MATDRTSVSAQRDVGIAGAIAVAGPLAYVVAVVVGGWLWPGYSHYAETISTLLSAGAPNQAVLVPLFAFYNVSIPALAWGLSVSLRPYRYGSVGPTFLVAAGVSGLVLFILPQGPPNDPLSGLGVEHTVVAGVDALCFLMALGFLWRRGSSDPEWSRWGAWTLVFLGVGIAAGAFGAASVSASYAGLAERLSIGTFLVWTEATALALIAWSNRRARSGAPLRGDRRPAQVEAPSG